MNYVPTSRVAYHCEGCQVESYAALQSQFYLHLRVEKDFFLKRNNIRENSTLVFVDQRKFFGAWGSLLAYFQRPGVMIET